MIYYSRVRKGLVISSSSEMPDRRKEVIKLVILQKAASTFTKTIYSLYKSKVVHFQLSVVREKVVPHTFWTTFCNCKRTADETMCNNPLFYLWSDGNALSGSKLTVPSRRQWVSRYNVRKPRAGYSRSYTTTLHSLNCCLTHSTSGLGHASWKSYYQAR